MEIVRQKYFRSNARTIGSVIMLFTVYQVAHGRIHGIGIPMYVLFNVLAITFWAANDIVRIDFKNKRIGEGINLFGIIYLSWTKYHDIEKIFINTVHTIEQDVYSLPRLVTLRKKTYKAFLKTAGGEKIPLMVDNNKDRLIEKLRYYNKTINTEIIDTTS